MKTFLPPVFAVALALLTPHALAAQNVAIGDTSELGVAYTWIETDESGIPVNVGVTLDGEFLTDLPGFMTQEWLNFPDVGEQSLWTHNLFDWNPNGHPPFMYSVPHFDFHFAIVPRDVMDRIFNGRHDIPVAPELIPPDYEPDSDPPFAISNMGVHYVDKAAREWNGGPFTETLIYGYYDGELLFMEPMITLEFLESKTNVTLPIKQPAEFARDGYYPTNYRIEYDESADQHHVVLTDFMSRAATASESKIVPSAISLSQNFPNPAVGPTQIRFRTEDVAAVRIEVFDMLGRSVATLVDNIRSPDAHEVRFDTRNLESGLYVYRMTAGSWSRLRTMHVINR